VLEGQEITGGSLLRIQTFGENFSIQFFAEPNKQRWNGGGGGYNCDETGAWLRVEGGESQRLDQLISRSRDSTSRCDHCRDSTQFRL